MTDIVERLRSANTSLNEGDCCGQLDASGTCMAPACIFGEALKMADEAADRIEQLEAEAKTRTLDYLGQVGQLSEELERLRAALRPLACTCDKAASDECSRAEVNCAFWNARAALEGVNKMDVDKTATK